MRITPRRHARELDAILNDVVNFAVSKILRSIGVQIGHPRIEILAHSSVATAVNSMTDRAPREEILPPFSLRFRLGCNWVGFVALTPWNGQISCRLSYRCLQWRRRGSSREAAPNKQDRANSSNERNPEKH